MSQLVSPVSQGKLTAKGNTNPSPNRARAWVFTLNNYTEEEYENVLSQCLKSLEYIIGKEVGDQGTPHLQGYVRYKTQKLFTTMQNAFPRAHLEPAKGGTQANYNYCSKSGNFETNIKNKIDIRKQIKDRLISRYKDVVWRPWQEALLAKMREPPASRTISWYFDYDGNSGKSFLAKYLKLHFNTIIADGKKDNIFNQLNEMLNNGLEPQIVILDVPRHNKDYLNYGVIEQLKDGCIYSGKYEGGECIIDNVHVVIFSNHYPDTEKMSEDRWDIHDITDYSDEVQN